MSFIGFVVYFGILINFVVTLPPQALLRRLDNGSRPAVFHALIHLVDPLGPCLGIVVASTHLDPLLGELVGWSCRIGPPVRILTALPVVAGPPWERCDTYLVLLGRRPGDVGAAVAGALDQVKEDSAQTRFVVVWTQDVVHARDLNATTAAVWSARRLNAVVVARARAGGHVQVYDFNPFDSVGGNCNDTSPRALATWKPGAGLVLTPGALGLFRFDARRLKLGGCPLRVGVRNQSIYVSFTRSAPDSWVLSGMLANILNACGKLLKFSYQPTELALYSEEVPRDNVTRAVFAKVSDGLLDLALVPGSLNGHFADLDIALPGWFNSWCYTWAVPMGSGSAQPLHYKLTQEFSSRTWGLIGASLALACVVTSVLAYCTRKWVTEEPDATEDVRWIAASTIGPLLSALLGRTHSRPPPRSSTLRVFLACWLYVGLVLSTAYTSSLKTLVSSPSRPDTICTVESLASSDLPIRQWH